MAKKKNTARKLSIPKDPKVFEFKVSLPGIKPLVWRSLLAHEFIELEELHGLIQITMGWNSYHLYQFQIGDVIYTDAETASELKNAKVISGQVLHEVLGDNKKFSYTYGFGDDWLHEIEIVATHPHDSRMQYPVCIGGSNAAPPDDCGGVHAFEELKKTLRGPESDEKDELILWLGGFYEPTTFDPNFINRFLLWPNDEDDLLGY